MNRTQLRWISQKLRGAARRLLKPVWSQIKPAQLRWADQALVGLRRDLPVQGIKARVAPPRAAAGWGTAPITVWLRYRRATCLERSIILQRWLMCIGQPHDVLIGVRSPEEAVMAHAWLDHEDPLDFLVVARIPSG
ncbi:MAG: lasso peptide biosynthesis B2 protein [Solirubrobacteraceae bacterium]